MVCKLTVKRRLTLKLGGLVLPLFSLALLVGAVLLFVVQPLVAKMVLPLFGGAPAVWNTCVLFFQAGLLVGYGYAHWAPRRLGQRPQALLHVALLLAAAALLPITVAESWAPPAGTMPALWLLWLLTLAVGLPYVLIAATAPLVQQWFAISGHRSAKDPYFLYVASNLGSMVALLSYPLLLEPTLALDQQSGLWLWGYLLLGAMLLACVVTVWQTPRQAPEQETHHSEAPMVSVPREQGEQPTPVASPTWALRVRWLALAFVPSSLMLCVTTYLTTDIAAIPLLWVIPLALYLLTFMLAFARKQPVPHAIVLRIMPLAIIVLTLVLLTPGTELSGVGVWLLLSIHLIGFVIIALACHAELARSRPSVTHLTEFYLWISLGGVLGGIFNALLAPLLFRSVAEYPLVLVMACLLRPPLVNKGTGQKEGKELHEKTLAARTTGKANPTTTAREASKRQIGNAPQAPAPNATQANPWRTFLRLDLAPALFLAVLTLALVFAAHAILEPNDPEAFRLLIAISFGLPLVVCYTFMGRPLRFGLGIAALFWAGQFTPSVYGSIVYAERSFFGIHRVTTVKVAGVGTFYRLVHGNTIHGQQNKSAPDQPLTYYHKKGPIGRVFAALEKGHFPLHKVGVVGLGVGTLAAYAQPEQTWTFFEIDPVVAQIARNPAYFTYWSDAEARGANLSVVLGDARLQLKAESAKHSEKFDLLVIDAFNSDSVPVHLLTREALQVYLDRLTDTGVLAFHISNNYLNLEPVLAELAADADLRCLSWFASTSDADKEQGKFASHWVVLGRLGAPLDQIRQLGAWHAVKGGNPQYLWTDQYSNLVSLLRWGGVSE